MSPFDPSQPINQLRRQDRAVNDQAWIKDFLRSAPYGVMATVQADQPFINVNLFAYDEAAHAIYFHSSDKGRTHFNIEQGGRICFNVSRMGRLLPADTARESSVEFASVTVFGQASIVTYEIEALHGLQILMDKYFPHLHPGQDYPVMQAREMHGAAVYRIEIEAWSGKQKVAAPDFPGAFFYGQPPAAE